MLLMLFISANLAVVLAENQTVGTSSSVSCSGSSAAEVTKDIKINKINVTVLASTCHRVCYILLGSGNPDMAGPGEI
ncbi:hypothetical protein WAI453_005451 [Rhynchosporium graminicola]